MPGLRMANFRIITATVFDNKVKCPDELPDKWGVGPEKYGCG
jgi:hypothetical protein